MKKAKRMTLVAGLALATVAAPAMAELSANVAATTNYIWRGVTQSNDGPAVQGGVDWNDKRGWYVGTWMSNVDFSNSGGNSEYELDFYGGYGQEINQDWAWDAGLIYYAYPLSTDVNFLEIYGSATWKWLNFGLNYTLTGEASSPSAFRSGDIYYYASADWALANDWSIGGTIGVYDFDDLSSSSADPATGLTNFGDYAHFQLVGTKSTQNMGDFSIGVDFNDLDGEDLFGKKSDDPRIWVAWGTTF